MNKRELAKVYSEVSTDTISIRRAEKEIDIDIFIKTLTEALLIGGEVKFPRIGVFEILTRQE